MLVVRNTRPCRIAIAGLTLLPNDEATIPPEHEEGVRASGLFRAGWLVEVAGRAIRTPIRAPGEWLTAAVRGPARPASLVVPIRGLDGALAALELALLGVLAAAIMPVTSRAELLRRVHGHQAQKNAALSRLLALGRIAKSDGRYVLGSATTANGGAVVTKGLEGDIPRAIPEDSTS